MASLVDEIRAKGEPTSILAAYRAPPGSESAARYYDAAAALIDTTGLYDLTGLLRRLDRLNGEEVSRLTPDIRSWLEKHRDAETLLEKATALEFGAYPSGTDYRYGADSLLRLANLADLRAIERLHAKDPEGAAEAVIQLLRIVRRLRANGSDLAQFLEAGTVSRAQRSIGPILELRPSPETLIELQDAFETQDRDTIVEESVLAERAFILGRYWDYSKRWFTNPGGGGSVPHPLWLAARPYVMHLVIAQVQLMTRFLDSSRRSWPERLEVGFPEEQADHPQRRGRFYFMTAAHSQRATVNAHRTRTRSAATVLAGVRTAICAIALERYRRTHDGAFPSQLADLVPAALHAVPVDPYSGKPLQYKVVHPDGFVVYSVGFNRADDGGRGAGAQLRRRWGANQMNAEPPDIGVNVGAQKED